jgi:hypothetical protein
MRAAFEIAVVDGHAWEYFWWFLSVISQPYFVIEKDNLVRLNQNL